MSGPLPPAQDFGRAALVKDQEGEPCGGQGRPFRGPSRVERCKRCSPVSHGSEAQEDGGWWPQRGVVSEAHSTLIHKVGNTTPSSAVSSAFYFMGDCTVCLSVVCSSGHCSSSELQLGEPHQPSLCGFLRPHHPAYGPLKARPWPCGW